MENKRYSKESSSDFEADIVAYDNEIQYADFRKITEDDVENSVSPPQEENPSDSQKEPLVMT